MSDPQKDEHVLFDSAEEQILHRPGMWIGSTKSTIKPISVIEEGQFVEKELEIIPAIAKLVEEIIVNSADEHIRTKNNPELRNWVLNKIVIRLDESGRLVVWDNGGITTKLHSTGVYPIEVIFGKLFSSSNYDDTKTRTTVGTNGVGSSLTNLFSTRFEVKSADGENEIKIVWTNNKQNKTEATVKSLKQHHTRVEAQLDLSRFGVTEIPYGVMKYIERLALILAASNPGLEVQFNDEKFKFKSFRNYLSMYGHDAELIGETNKDWEVYIAPSDGHPKRYAIVNGAECNDGTHVKRLDDAIRHRVQQIVDKKKWTSITPHMIKNSYTVFINMKQDKPEYSSQAKTELTNEMWHLNSKGDKVWLTVSPKLTKQLQSGFIIDSLRSAHEEKTAATNSKEVNRKAKELKRVNAKSVRKLIDATGRKASERQNAELWIFEGASAGSGFRNARSPKTQGCYFLKGKCKNSIHMSTISILNNQEFSDIIIALGLDVRNPDDISKLRYGKVIISTDSDVDGHSIFGQLLTLFMTHFPALVNAGMIYRAISPLHKATKSKEVQYFYDTDKFNEFIKGKKGYKTSYFKGLGSLQKDDYKAMVQDSKLERYSIGDNCVEIMYAFMGKDSAPRKRLLEAEV